jgi:hypothetical protein
VAVIPNKVISSTAVTVLDICRAPLRELYGLDRMGGH